MNSTKITLATVFLFASALMAQVTFSHKVNVYKPNNPARSASGLLTVTADRHGLSNKNVLVAVMDADTQTVLDTSMYKYTVDAATKTVSILLPPSTANHTVAVTIDGLPDAGLSPSNRPDDLRVGVDINNHKILLAINATEQRQEYFTWRSHSYFLAHPQALAYDPTLTGVVRIWLQDGRYFAGISTTWGTTKVGLTFFTLVDHVTAYPTDAGYPLMTITFENGAPAKTGNSDDRAHRR